MGRNVILTDCDVPNDWNYKLGIEERTKENWKVIKCVSNKLHGSMLKDFLRYCKYFLFSFKMFVCRNRYDRVLAWQQFYGLLLAFFCRLFKVKKAPQIYIMTFIFKPKKYGIYNKLISFVLTSGYITKYIVLSDSEKKYYSELFGIDPNLFHSTRIGVSDESGRIKPDNDTEKYYLAVGRSNRDYKFLRNAWKPLYGKLIIINESYSEEKKEGIEVLKKCYGDDYLKKVANCYAQIIPLEDVNIASGSLSFLQAMMLSKPTIVTENSTVHDYIENEVNGIIINKNEEELQKALEYLDNPIFYKRMCDNARKDYLDKYSQYSLGLDIGEMLNNT